MSQPAEGALTVAPPVALLVVSVNVDMTAPETYDPPITLRISGGTLYVVKFG